MHGAIDSLRILPADVDTTFFRPPPAETGFRDLLHGAIDDIQKLQSQAEAKVAGVVVGNGTDVHSALIAVEKADLSFQLMMQVRTKIISAYEEISRMQF